MLYCLSNEARARPFFFPPMTFSPEFKENLLWDVARFMVDSKPGDLMALPAASFLVKAMDGSFFLSRTESVFSRLIDPTSDKIVATVERWAKEAA
jgi:hypothetical protein